MDKGVIRQGRWVEYDLWAVWIEVYGTNLRRISKRVMKMIEHYYDDHDKKIE